MNESKRKVSDLVPYGTLSLAHDEFEPACYLCEKKVSSGETYVSVTCAVDAYAVCVPCANRPCRRRILALDDWRRRMTNVNMPNTPSAWRPFL